MVEDESQIGKSSPEDAQRKGQDFMKKMGQKAQEESDDWERRDGSNLVKTKSGRGYKPGGQYMRSDEDSQQYDNRNVNMGDFQRKEDNPFASVINFAKGDWNDKKK